MQKVKQGYLNNMNITKAIAIINEATKDCDIQEAVYIARIRNLQPIIEAYEVLQENYSYYQIVNRLYNEKIQTK